MDKNGAQTFCYSKASGVLKKAFLKENRSLLFQQKSLIELWTLLFNTEAPLIPETLLAEEIEKKALNQLINDYQFFLNQFDVPPAFLVDQLKLFEVENLKQMADCLNSEEKIPLEKLHIINIGKYGNLKYSRYPDLHRVTSGTEYEWLKQAPEIHQQREMEFKLDLQYIRGIWNSINEYSGEEKQWAEKLFLDEYVMKNILWALRLSVYYNFQKEDIIQHLFYVTDAPNMADPIAGPAIKILRKDITDYSQWQNVFFAKCINPYIAGENWCVDPAWIEKRYSVEKNRRTYHLFHTCVNESVALAAWFQLKLFELSCIRTASESIKLNISSQEALEATGVREVNNG